VIYNATALSKQFANGRKSGTIVFTSGSIEFIWDEGSVTWALIDIEISSGGTGNNFVYLKNKKNDEVTLYTSDKKILKEAALKSDYRDNGLTKVKNSYRKRWAIWSSIGGLFLVPFILFFVFRGQIIGKIANQLPVSVERTIGKQLFTLLTVDKTFVKDSLTMELFLQRMKPLLKAVNMGDSAFSFYIIKDTTVNAFALPGGNVVVHSGLINKSDNWEEVMGVVAHEMAHVSSRHHVRGILSQVGYTYLLSAVFGDFSAAIDFITSIGGNLEAMKYSRDFEYEADRKGMDYMKNAGMTGYGMITFFEKLDKMSQGQANSVMMNMLSTHPATMARIAKLKENLGDTQITKIVDTDFIKFKNKLNQILISQTK
jgi:beta-barrel assembly-enhancing protease